MFPLETVRTRLAVDSGKYSGVWDCLTQVAHKEGFGSLYKVRLVIALPC